jgi:hypothetical protein
MERISLKIYLILCLALMRLQSWAQDDFDDDFGGRSRGDIVPMDGMEGLEGYNRFHIRISDILLVVFLIAACYVFGKIWKGCTYMIIILAAFMFFFMR